MLPRAKVGRVPPLASHLLLVRVELRALLEALPRPSNLSPSQETVLPRPRLVSIILILMSVRIGKKTGKKEGKKEEEYLGVKPTKALGSYIFFSNENVPKIKADEGVDHRTAMKRAGEIWGGLSADAKKKYEDMHDKDLKR